MTHDRRELFRHLESDSCRRGRLSTCSLLAMALLSAIAAAQQDVGVPDADVVAPSAASPGPAGSTVPGFGATYRRHVLQGPIPDFQILSAAYVQAGRASRMFVVGGNNGVQPNRLYEYDALNRRIVRAWDQPTTSIWGMRDLTTDGRYVFGSDESLRIQVFDTLTNSFQTPIDVSQAAQANGITCVRALAWVDWDPRANVPFDGFAFTDIAATQTVLVNRLGHQVRAFSTPVPSAYGLAWIPFARFLLYFSQTDPYSVGGRIHFTAVDLVTGLRLPQLEFTGDVTVPGTAPDLNGGVAGGVDVWVEDGVLLAVAVHQAVEDTLVLYELGRVAFYEWKGTPCGRTFTDIRPHGAPDLGNTGFKVRMAGAPPSNGMGVCLIGTSDQSYLGIPLPMNLSGLGYLGCHLRVAMDVVTMAQVDLAGQAAASLPLPPDPALLGATLHTQFAHFDAGLVNVSFTPQMSFRVGGWVGRLLRAGACAIQINAIYAGCAAFAPPGGYATCVCDAITPAGAPLCSALERAAYRALNGC